MAGQEVSDGLPLEYNWSAAALSGVESGENIPPRFLVPPYLPSALGPHAQNVVYQNENPHRAHPLIVESSIFSGACEAWRRYLHDAHGLHGPFHGGPFYTPCRRARLQDGICYEFSMVDLSRTQFRLSDLVDPPCLPLLQSGYTGVSRRYTGVIVSLSGAIVFRFPPFDEEIRELPAVLSCTDDDTQIQSSPGETWPDNILLDTNGSPVRVIQAGDNVPATAFALRDPVGVVEVLLQVVAGPEMLPRTGLREVELHEG